MGFAEERVFEHILRNLSRFRHIHVTSLAQSLSCLTEADRDELQAREEARGSQAAVFKFYQFLKCHRGWVADLIRALHLNNAGHLAEELQRVYDRHRPRDAPGPSAGARGTEAAAAPGAPTEERPRRDAPGPARGADEESAGADRAASAPSAPGTAPKSSTASESSTALGSGMASESSRTSGSSTASRSAVTLDSGTASESSRTSGSSTASRSAVTLGSGTALESSRTSGSSTASRSAVTLPSGTASESSTSLESRIPVQESSPTLPGSSASSGLGAEAAVPGRGWPGRQQHPVCVDDGYFGNARHLHRGGAAGSLLPAPSAARRNEPEEVHFSSAELPSGPGVRGALHVQPQLAAAPAPPGTLQEHEGDGAPGSVRGGARVDPAPPVSAPAAASPSSGSSEAPAAEAEAPGMRDGSAPSVPVRREVPPASTAAFPGRLASDAELSKPGTLLSGAGGHATFPVPSGPYSGDSGRLELSSDPLLLSTDGSWGSSPAPAPLPREEESTGAPSHPPPGSDGASLRTHELRVEQRPSVPLGAAPEGDGPLGEPTGSNLTQSREPAGDIRGFSSSYVAPAAGIALISALAFLVYARLQK